MINITQTKLYRFDQNNSGGSFRENEDICNIVVIEAHSAEEANTIAKNIGIYFDGIKEGLDCPCCGDRWTPVSELDTDIIDDINNIKKTVFSDTIIIHYLNKPKEMIYLK